MGKKVYIITRSTESSPSVIYEVWGKKELAKKRVDILNQAYCDSDNDENYEWYELNSFSVLDEADLKTEDDYEQD